MVFFRCTPTTSTLYQLCMYVYIYMHAFAYLHIYIYTYAPNGCVYAAVNLRFSVPAPLEFERCPSMGAALTGESRSTQVMARAWLPFCFPCSKSGNLWWEWFMLFMRFLDAPPQYRV